MKRFYYWMRRNHFALAVLVPIGVALLACLLTYCYYCHPGLVRAAPPVEELLEFVGKTEEEVRERFGPPSGESYTEYAVPPKEIYDTDKARWDELLQQTVKKGLFYGDIEVMISVGGKVVGLRQGNTRIYPAPEEPEHLPEAEASTPSP